VNWLSIRWSRRLSPSMKYADDTYLLVGSNNVSTAADEFSHINAWARSNNLQLNTSKTRELVISRRRLRTGVGDSTDSRQLWTLEPILP